MAVNEEAQKMEAMDVSEKHGGVKQQEGEWEPVQEAAIDKLARRVGRLERWAWGRGKAASKVPVPEEIIELLREWQADIAEWLRDGHQEQWTLGRASVCDLSHLLRALHKAAEPSPDPDEMSAEELEAELEAVGAVLSVRVRHQSRYDGSLAVGTELIERYTDYACLMRMRRNAVLALRKRQARENTDEGGD